MLALLASATASAATNSSRPNFVFVLTDDQDLRLDGFSDAYTEHGSLAAMPIVRQRLMGEGAQLTNFFVNTPICCPSRTEFFSGRYFHNVGPPSDTAGKCMHADTSFASSNATGLFGALTRHGYRTGVFGKVTNDQQHILDALVAANSATYIDSPVEFNDFQGKPYFHFNGTTSWTETLPDDASAAPWGTLYQTAQIGNRTLRWLDGVLTAQARAPFFAYLGPHAPHFPAQPAPWHADAFAGISAPRTPNFNASSPDKAQHVRQNPPLTDRAKCWEDQHMRDRWASLLAVDDVVGAVYDRLAAADALATTYFFYSSDHGYKLGQWRVGTSKQHPYDTDVRVPFLVRGPGIAAGATVPALAGNVDLLPTMLELAGIAAPDGVDGRSLAPLLLGTAPPRAWRTAFLNEYLSVGTYWNDHSKIWAEDESATAARCGGVRPRGPALDPTDNHTCVERDGVGDGECYYVDSTQSNSWRSLRVLNATHDLTYVEYDPNWTFAPPLQHRELYDNAADPYQLKSLAASADPGALAALHAELEAYWRCKGATCP